MPGELRSRARPGADHSLSVMPYQNETKAITSLEGMDKSTVYPLLMFTLLRGSYFVHQRAGNKLNGNVDQLKIQRKG